jgi:GxxExxY protein
VPLQQPINLKHAGVTESVIGVFYDVYNELGYEFLESVYHDAMVIALREAGVEFEAQVPVPVWFREHEIGHFKADMIVANKVLVELKCARVLDSAHEAQLLHY